MTVTPGFHQKYPHFEISIIFRANKTKTTYGCYFKNGISFNSEEIDSNFWNFNGNSGLAPVSAFIMTLTIFAVFKYLLI